MIADERVDERVEVRDVVGTLHLTPQEVACVPSVPIAAKVGSLGVNDHESVGLRDCIEARLGPHVLGAAHTTMKHDHRRSRCPVRRRVDDNRPSILVLDLEGQDHLRLLCGG